MKLFLLNLLLLMSLHLNANEYESFEQLLQSKESKQDKQSLFDITDSQVSQWSQIDQGRYLHAKGLHIESLGDIQAAKATFTQSILIFEALNEPNEFWVKSLQDRSYMDYLLTNDTTVYCKDRAKALEIARLQKNAAALVGTLTNYVFCMKDGFSGFKSGLALLTEAAQVAKYNDLSAQHSAMIHNATALLYRSNFLHEKAYEYLLNAYNDWSKEKDYQDMFNMQHSMVGESIKLRKRDQALEHVSTLFSMSETQPEFKDFTFFAHFNQGRVYYYFGEFDACIESMNQALALKDTTSEQYFIDQAEAMRAVAKSRSGHEFPLVMVSDPEHLIKKLKGQLKSEFQAVIHIQGRDFNKAIDTLWLLNDQNEMDKLVFTKNNTAALSMAFDDEIHQLQKQALQDQLNIQSLELAREKSSNEIVKYTRTIAVLALLLFVVLVYLLLKSRKFYRAKSRTDFMTGLQNRRASLEKANQMLIQAKKSNQGMGLLIFDIDDFKQVNDQYGHIVGDRVIKSVANAVANQMSEGMVLGRIGGEEFITVIPSCDKQALNTVAERIRVNVSASEVKENQQLIKSTISLGLALYRGEDSTTVTDLMKKADTALYIAKNSGKNQAQWSE